MKNHFLLLTILFLSLTSQAQVTKTINLTSAGTLTTLLTTEEKSTITELHVTGAVDARDIKCMRDEMPGLSVINMNSASITAYSGTGGTSSSTTEYFQNELPPYAFYNSSTKSSKTSLIYIVLPNTLTAIETYAFSGCSSLTTLSLPNTLNTIAAYAFRSCSALEFI